MTDLRIVEFDPLAQDAASVALLQGWVDAGMETARAEFGDRHTQYSLEEVREMQREVTTSRIHRLVALEPDSTGGEQVVAEGAVHLPLRDNLRLAALFLSVRPHRRRRGIGSALLAELERIARAADRTTLCLESDLAVQDDRPAYAFGPAHGYRAALVNVRQDLDLPTGDLDPVLGRLEADAREHARDYDVLTWWDGVPQEWVEQRAGLSARMSTDAPMGEVDVEAQVWDAERVHEQFRVARAMGRRVVETVAVHRATGLLAGYTDLAVAEHTPDMAYQWDTLVLTQHRGHRLGQLVKAANLRALRSELPAVRRVTTWNAQVNAPMLRVNREMGFVEVGVNTEWQKLLAPMPAGSLA